jgi:DNA-binding LytR/AlgR family response regulator
MKILIVEDERPTAEDIAQLIRSIYRRGAVTIHIETTLENALYYVREKPIDVLLLDLNLNSKDGFEILRQAVAHSFHTIVLSANTSRAIEAFAYGVIDFIPKPYTLERVREAFARVTSQRCLYSPLKYLSVKKGYDLKLVSLESIEYIKAVNVYSELHLSTGIVEMCDKALKNLEQLLPENFLRVHRSYIVKVEAVAKLRIRGGGKYAVVMQSGKTVPVSRAKINDVRLLFRDNKSSKDVIFTKEKCHSQKKKCRGLCTSLYS